MTYLLDVNMLIALVDRAHVHHDLAQLWFTSLDSPWATCPITQLGVVRVLSGPKYSNAISPGEVIRALEGLQQLGMHEFWPEDVSLTDSRTFRHAGLRRAHEVTDTYLLGLAGARGGMLATLDRRLSSSGVHNGAQALLLVAP